MTTQFHTHPKAPVRPPLHAIAPQTRKPAFQPILPPGFTRRELRRLVAEMID